MSVNIIAIGDPHFQVSNIPEVDLFISKIYDLALEKNPDAIVILGDLLHTHEKVHTVPLNKAYEFIDKMRQISKTYVIVGNHDMCFGRDTPILMFNGEAKMSQDIIEGDVVMGDDLCERRVISVCSGRKKMYGVHQSGTACDYIVSENHTLVLCQVDLSGICDVKDYVIVEMSVEEYVNSPTDIRRNLYGIKLNPDVKIKDGRIFIAEREDDIFRDILGDMNATLKIKRYNDEGYTMEDIEVFTYEDKLKAVFFIRLVSICSKIEVYRLDEDEYFGFAVDENSRLLLGDGTVVHNCNNQQFLSENHWLNGLKEWDNVKIIDKVHMEMIKDTKFVFAPYVYPSRFQEALNTLNDNWRDAQCIFAHQEFKGCKMGAIISEEGDVWPESYPQVISGHIHSNQRPQDNVYYPGAAMQHAFGESDRNIIPCLRFVGGEIDINEVDLGLPRKKIVYVNMDSVDEYKHEEQQKTDDKIKLTLSGSLEEFKAFKKTKKYKKMVEDGVKVIFKPKKIRKEKRSEGEEEKKGEDIVEEREEVNFKEILSNIVRSQNNDLLVQAYELIVNKRNMNFDDVFLV